MRLVHRAVASGAALLALASSAVAATPSAAAAEPATWRLDLTAADTEQHNVTHTARGVALADPRQSTRSQGPERGYGFYVARTIVTGRPVADLRLDLRATVPAAGEVRVEARGRSALGWTEWRSFGADGRARLPRPVDLLQVRLTMLAGAGGQAPSVESATLVPATPNPALATNAAAAVQAVGYRVFGTREGLVGGRTANGHVIGSRDHFVALPSRRALNPNDRTRDFQVQVCYARTGRCETAPVWDVGPWNTRDDYWNPSATREMWRDLPQGTPEAQAAYQNGYNGGRDEFGRTVANPAGIDLADGTFWDGLGMTDNDWVDVTFLWTGGPAPSSLAWGASQDVVNASGAGVLDGRPDLIARIGDIGYVYPHLGGSGTSMFAATGIRIGSGWSNITALAVADVATYTGLVVPDGRPDLIARIGDIGYVYPHQGGSGTTLFTPTGLRIGSGWSNITALAAADVADIAGAGAPDGRPDLIARIGDVGYIYPHLGGNGFADTGIRIGSGWTSITGITARDITNATGGGTPDGRPDLIIRIGDIGYVYPHQAGRGTAMFAATGTQIGSGWTSISALTVTDVANTAAAGTPDGRPDLVARIGDIGYVYPHIGGYGTTTFAGTGTRIGSGWTSISLLT